MLASYSYKGSEKKFVRNQFRCVYKLDIHHVNCVRIEVLSDLEYLAS